MSTEEKVRAIIAEHLDVDIAKVVESAAFVEDLGADSLAVVEMVLAFEETFDLDIPDEAAESITTVAEAIAFIKSQTDKG